MGLTVLFTHLKIILLQCFQFSVFSFSKISSIQTDPQCFICPCRNSLWIAKNSICVSRREEGRKSAVSELRENGKEMLKADPRGVHHETLLSVFRVSLVIFSRMWCYLFFFFWEMDSSWYINQENENPPIQMTRYPLEHTPTKYERKNFVSLIELRHEPLYCLADVHEQKKYSLMSLIEIQYPW